MAVPTTTDHYANLITSPVKANTAAAPQQVGRAHSLPALQHVDCHRAQAPARRDATCHGCACACFPRRAPPAPGQGASWMQRRPRR
eukprot:7072033-Pyramimonas_sp.AAC.1